MIPAEAVLRGILLGFGFSVLAVGGAVAIVCIFYELLKLRRRYRPKKLP